MVTLATHMCGLLSTPLPPDASVHGEDLYGLGRLFHDLGHLDRAEAAYVQAAQACASAEVREMAMRDLAYLLKRQERRAEALYWWRRLVEGSGAVYACEELAKHYEWHDQDLPQAVAWTERGIRLAEALPPGLLRREILAELDHRLARLQGKMYG
jgi:tetratricopeptide (TPR) repeat protein